MEIPVEHVRMFLSMLKTPVLKDIAPTNAI